MEVFFGNSTEKFAGKMKSISGACAYPYLKSYTKKTGADEGVRQKIRVDYRYLAYSFTIFASAAFFFTEAMPFRQLFMAL